MGEREENGSEFLDAEDMVVVAEKDRCVKPAIEEGDPCGTGYIYVPQRGHNSMALSRISLTHIIRIFRAESSDGSNRSGIGDMKGRRGEET